ncbi:FKBP-type peptidyl-prolyl cis-trans isomerase [Mucilaginibacter aquaedulcis]|uniref:FKBP-type peptidyl-prolyl cis-trans isomerase n=1 Tax=Mucilaginibacter aquaedulcis TaxID=1187081 RepID=UPI0025B5110D|nr:FKBP-type peptidyl-prolyl cis-trans isomerase [Mucilaginibacter aquaedulcis]MDN3550364.1 FKBP-type peptidyl-prolyl cis-trans isomerase [Mucilaginibacter aquaedulcis]
MKKAIYILLPALSLLTLGAYAQAPTPRPNMQPTGKGAFYQLFTNNTGEKIKLNDVITFNFIQKTDKDSILYSTYKAGKPVQAQIQPSQNVGDLMDVFPLLTVKDSALVKVPTDSVFKGHEESRPPFFPKGSYLTFILKIEKVQSLNDAIAEKKAEGQKLKDAEAASAGSYITSHKLTPVTTASGLKYMVTRPSVKRKPLAGDTVLVNYTGRTLSGKVFDSSVETEAKGAGLDQPGRKYEPISVVLGQGQVIPGWDEGLLLLNEGSKATLIVPSSLAYGDRGAGEDIAPYSTLLFDVELVKVKPGKHAVAPKTGIMNPAKKRVYKKPLPSKKTN